MSHNWEVLCQLLAKQADVKSIPLSSWNDIIGQARTSSTLGTLAARIKQSSQLDDVPEQVRWHLNSGAAIATKYRRDLQWEIEQIAPVLSALAIKTVLLKGAAYVLRDEAFSEGRVFSDIDLLVPFEHIARLEEGLKWKHWRDVHHSKYDQRYFRKWMHEIPPLQHAKRQTTLDIHHTILPRTANLKPDAKLLFNAVAPISNRDGLYTLSPSDMILHCATHLFWDSEFHHGFRDIVDFEGLVSRYCVQDSDWQTLIDRAASLDLIPPLFYGLRYANKLLNLQVPEEVLNKVTSQWQPKSLSTMDQIFIKSILPDHPSCKSKTSYIWKNLFFIRGHYLRMPLYLLLPHLAYKAFVTPIQNHMENKQKEG